MPSTRGRAMIVTLLTTLIVLADLLGLIDYSNLGGVVASVPMAESVFSAFIVSVLLFLGVQWVLFFKMRSYSWFAIGLFPSVTVFPFLLIAEENISNIFSGLGQVSIALITSVAYGVLVYLLILTANVLNGTFLFDIPLGQAGKAAQFIFSLTAVYFLIVFLFGAEVGIAVRVLCVSALIFYFCFSCLWITQLQLKQLLMSLVMLVLSVWPISSVYVSLAAVVLLYMMLNIALEMRENISKMIWVEHGLLVLLVLIILFTNSIWGINGSLI